VVIDIEMRVEDDRLVLRAAAAVAPAILVLAGTAGASTPPKGEKIRLNPADQAAARAATLRRTDLTPNVGWRGGPRKPDLSPPPVCPSGYSLDASRYVVTGAAEADWTRGSREADSQAEVLQTPAMVAGEWRQQVQAPAAVACLRAVTAAALAKSGAKQVSFKQIPFPHVAPYTKAFRILASVSTQGFTASVVEEVVVMAKGRTEMTLFVSGFGSVQKSVAADAIRYAKIVAGRATA